MGGGVEMCIIQIAVMFAQMYTYVITQIVHFKYAVYLCQVCLNRAGKKCLQPALTLTIKIMKARPSKFSSLVTARNLLNIKIQSLNKNEYSIRDDKI